MTSISSVSLIDLRWRRQTLRRQRRRQAIHRICRTLAVGTLAGCLCWGTTAPVWTIDEPEQIAIEGNEFISDRAIRSLLPLSYPQSLLQIEPQVIAQKLESPQSAIAKANVTRQLFPPSLTVRVQERQPVALAIDARPNAASPESQSAKLRSKLQPVGLLDENGVSIPIESYVALKASVPLPALKIVGARKQYLPYWPQMYQILRRSRVKVFQIDWRDPTNLILKTELGVVHLGPYSSHLEEQLLVLERLRQLPALLEESSIAYIDLKNPELPAIQMRSTKPAPNRDPDVKTPKVGKKTNLNP